MFITYCDLVGLWRTHTATHPGQSLAHPAQVCPSHNKVIKCTTQQQKKPQQRTQTQELGTVSYSIICYTTCTTIATSMHKQTDTAHSMSLWKMN